MDGAATDETIEQGPLAEPAELPPVPEFLRAPEQARYLVLVNHRTAVAELVKAPVSLRDLLQAAEGLGNLREVLIMVPRNSEGC